MTVAPWQMGPAQEILQAKVLEQTAQPPTSPPVEPPPPPPPVEPSEETPIGIPEPKYEGLEILPDEELSKLAERHGLKVDKRWGRKRLILELAANGVTSA